MLLGNKKKQGEEQNWCIVLNPLRNEIDKKRVARAISDVFSLSTEEAVDLVSNTPIILLDNLTRNVAAKVKEYFRSAGAEIVLTNDIFYKRKCYRTVWPEPPNLSFLHNWDPMKAPVQKEEILNPALCGEIFRTPRKAFSATLGVASTANTIINKKMINSITAGTTPSLYAAEIVHAYV